MGYLCCEALPPPFDFDSIPARKMAEVAAVSLKALTLASKLIEDKIRGQILSELKDSDVSGQQLREFILRDLEEIKEKLDGLSRVDLLTSLNFFRDGIILHQEYLKRSSYQEESDDKSVPASFLASQLATVGISATDSEYIPKEEGTESFLVEAKTKFQKSSDHAVKAISNEALKPIDRIFAARLRIVATILEHIDNTEIPLVLCKNYLKQVNCMPEVVNNIIVQFGTRTISSFRKIFNANERQDFIWSVISLNRLLWNYAHVCEVDGSYYLDWPLIDLGEDGQLHPVLDRHVRKSFYWSLTPEPDTTDDKKDDVHLNCPQGIAVASNGNFIIADTCNNCIKVFSCNGKHLLSCELPFSNESPSGYIDDINFWPRCVAVSEENMIYAGSSRGRREDAPMQAEIVAFNEKGEFLRCFGKDIFDSETILTSMVIDQDGRLLVTDDSTNCIHVFSLDGQYQSRIGEWELHEDYSHITVTNNGHILVTHWDHVRIYDHDGKFASKYVTKDYGLPLAGIAFDANREYTYVLCKAYKHLDKYNKPNIQIYDKEWDLKGVISLPKAFRSSRGMAVTITGFVGVVNVDANEVIVI